MRPTKTRSIGMPTRPEESIRAAEMCLSTTTLPSADVRGQYDEGNTHSQRAKSRRPRCGGTCRVLRCLGNEIPESTVWRTDSVAHHVEVPMSNGVGPDLDSQQLAASYDAGWSLEGPGIAIGFSLSTRDAVDERCAELTDAGYSGYDLPTTRSGERGTRS